MMDAIQILPPGTCPYCGSTNQLALIQKELTETSINSDGTFVGDPICELLNSAVYCKACGEFMRYRKNGFFIVPISRMRHMIESSIPKQKEANPFSM